MGSMTVKRIMMIGALLVAVPLIIGSGVLWWGAGAQQHVTTDQQRLNEAMLVFKDTRYNVVQIQQLLNDAVATGLVAENFRNVESQRVSAQKNLDRVALLLPDLAPLILEIKPQLDRLPELGKHMVEIYVKQGQAAGNAFMLAPSVGFDPLVQSIDKQLAQLSSNLSSRLDSSTSQQQSMGQLVLTLNLLFALIVLGVLILSTRFQWKRLDTLLGGEPQDAVQLMQALAKGVATIDLKLKKGDETSLLALIGQLARQLVENQRIRQALDNVTTSVMIADHQHNIIYMNQSVLEMLQKAESDIRKDLPAFNVRTLMGSSIDNFHKNPAHQRGMLARLNGVHRAEIVVGGRTFGLVASPVSNAAGERLGTAVEWLDRTATLLLEQENAVRRAKEDEISAENARIRNALDHVSTCVMIADANQDIIYMNQSVLEMLQRAESDLRKDLPNFDARNLIGRSIDNFHKNPAHQRSMLASLNSTYRTQIKVGGRVFSLIANPVQSPDGQRLGTAVEWKDRTLEVQVEEEVAEIVSKAVRGDFEQRVKLEGKDGFFKTLGEQLNQLLDMTRRGLEDIAQVLGAMAHGDLTRNINNEYHGLFGTLKENTNSTVERLREIVQNIKESTDSISTASREIAAGNSNLSSRTEQQAASLEETASSMEEITSTVKQNADNAKKANSLAIGASDIASRGGQVVGQVVSTMSEINDSARKIVDIISVIDGIAFQTNILALNAAVEAARAGEQGRGFAVVASEVRNLAQRSAGAAKEIKELIGNSVEKVESGSRLVDEAGRTMQEIVASITRVTDIMSEISAASVEQSSGIEQVNLAVTQMDENTQKNAALVEEAAAAAESLEEQARNLSEAVAMFKLQMAERMKSASSGQSSAKPVAQPVRPPVQQLARPKSQDRALPRMDGHVAPVVASRDADGDWEEF